MAFAELPLNAIEKPRLINTFKVGIDEQNTICLKPPRKISGK